MHRRQPHQLMATMESLGAILHSAHGLSRREAELEAEVQHLPGQQDQSHLRGQCLLGAQGAQEGLVLAVVRLILTSVPVAEAVADLLLLPPAMSAEVAESL